MRSFKIVSGDIYLNEYNEIEMVEGKEEEVQCIERILTTCTNEWFLNKKFGLKYSEIQGKGITDEQIRIALTKAILQENRVQEIEIINIERDNKARTVNIKIVCKMKSGNVIKVVRTFE